MSNPFLVQVPFAYQGNKNTIQLERQQSQDEEDATYKAGFPPVTMAKEELGGKPPKGLDFNGIFYELSSPIAHYCKGGRIYFDQEYANSIGGYPKGHIVASNDNSKDFISLIDGNTLDPNGSNIAGYWAIYSGQGSIPTASSTISGTVKLINNLNSQAVDAALTAAQGRALFQMFANDLSGEGYVNMPNPALPEKPFILRWGTGTVSVTASVNKQFTKSFPFKFPTSCISVMCKNRDIVGSDVTAESWDSSGFTGFALNIASANIRYTYWAIGY